MRKSALVLIPALCAAVALAAPAFAAEGKAAEKSASDAKSGKDKKDKAHTVSLSPSYLGFDPVYASIFDGDSIRGMLMVGFGLDVPDENLRSQVEAMMPVLRDLYVRNLMSFAASSVRPWRQPDVEAIAAGLQRVTDLQLKRKGAKILLAQVAIRLKN
jgi:flagellar basal body-associated protein FliL